MPTVLSDDSVLIPHLPDWSTPPECGRSWETGLEVGITIGEERQAVRQTPLWSLKWSVLPHDGRENEILAETVREALKQGNATTPWWGRGYKLGAAGVAPGATVIPVSALVPAAWLPAVGAQIWAAGLWHTDGGAEWELWTIAAVTAGTLGGEHAIEIEDATALTLGPGALAVWPLLAGRFTCEEIPRETPLLGRYRMQVEQPMRVNPGISMSDPIIDPPAVHVEGLQLVAAVQQEFFGDADISGMQMVVIVQTPLPLDGIWC